MCMFERAYHEIITTKRFFQTYSLILWLIEKKKDIMGENEILFLLERSGRCWKGFRRLNQDACLLVLEKLMSHEL